MRRLSVCLLLLSASACGAVSFAPYCTPYGRVDQVILKAVSQAHRDIRLATYSFDWEELGRLLARKKRQGIAVTVVCESWRGQEGATGLEDAVRVETGRGSFHAKLAVIDRQTVIAGSVNLTLPAMREHHNNLLVIEDGRIADFCCRVCDSWWNGEPPPACLRTAEVDIYIGPAADPFRRILSEIAAARRSVRFIQYRFTDADVAHALCEKKAEGLLVAGMLDGSGLYPFSVLEQLRRAGCPVRKACLAGLLHDKTLIVDERVVITGSCNLSSSARKNVETVLVVRNREVASAYLAEWLRLWRWKSVPADAG